MTLHNITLHNIQNALHNILHNIQTHSTQHSKPHSTHTECGFESCVERHRDTTLSTHVSSCPHLHHTLHTLGTRGHMCGECGVSVTLYTRFKTTLYTLSTHVSRVWSRILFLMGTRGHPLVLREVTSSCPQRGHDLVQEDKRRTVQIFGHAAVPPPWGRLPLYTNILDHTVHVW